MLGLRPRFTLAPREASPGGPAVAALLYKSAAFPRHFGRTRDGSAVAPRGDYFSAAPAAAAAENTGSTRGGNRNNIGGRGDSGTCAGGGIPAAVAPGGFPATTGPDPLWPGRRVPRSRAAAATPRTLEDVCEERQGRGGTGGGGDTAETAGADAAGAFGLREGGRGIGLREG